MVKIPSVNDKQNQQLDFYRNLSHSCISMLTVLTNSSESSIFISKEKFESSVEAFKQENDIMDKNVY